MASSRSILGLLDLTCARAPEIDPHSGTDGGRQTPPISWVRFPDIIAFAHVSPPLISAPPPSAANCSQEPSLLAASWTALNQMRPDSPDNAIAISKLFPVSLRSSRPRPGLYERRPKLEYLGGNTIFRQHPYLRSNSRHSFIDGG